MKKNSLAILLVGLLALSVVATAALSFTYVRSMRKLLTLQAYSDRIRQSLAVMRGLAADSVEYSKRNPGMEPILESVGIKIRPDVTQTPSPSNTAPRQTPAPK